MTQSRPNPYDDPARAGAYATLGMDGTYYLAYRDLPTIIQTHARGTRALDFGCGTGRSTRFLRDLGWSVVGVDSAEPMVAEAKARDPNGTYLLVPPADLSTVASTRYDLILAVFPFDNIAPIELKTSVLAALRSLLSSQGCLINVCAAEAVYHHEWLSFSCRDFPENRQAKNGDQVWAIMNDGPDRRPIADTLWTEESHHQVYRDAGLTLIATHRPLGTTSEPFAWISETTVSPWIIEVLR